MPQSVLAETSEQSIPFALIDLLSGHDIAFVDKRCVVLLTLSVTYWPLNPLS